MFCFEAGKVIWRDGMNSVILKKLEFDKVAVYASGFCISTMGRDRLLEHELFFDPQTLQEELSRVLELKSFLAGNNPLPFSNLPDTRPLLRKLELIDCYLEPDELLDIFHLLQSSVQLRRFMFTNREIYPRLNDFTIRLWLEKSLQYAIMNIVDEFAQVRNTASDGLMVIRKTLQESRLSLRRKMERLLGRCREHGWLMEDTVALKNGRLVLGLRVEYKHKLAGYIQDYSQTGQTVFIEPAETLEISNRIQELEIEERREIERILKTMSDAIREELANIRHNQDLLAGFDSINARARLALDTSSVFPAISTDGTFKIIKGFHPWLLISHRRKGETVYPLDMELGSDDHVLVISGPNAGGKSVAMKTAGLLSCMLLHGYLLPCSESSVFPMFRDIFIEIGDEQSIENDLSTFSSHLSAIKNILLTACRESLVLIDELCSGTDVEEGSAIARAVIEELLIRGARTIVTTHLGELKVYAHERQGVVNGAMEFDKTGLAPTFRFLKGLPGNSFAFAMLQRMNFPVSVSARAAGFMSEGRAGMERMLEDLKSQIDENRALKAALERERNEFDGLMETLQRDRAETDRLRHELKTKAIRDMQKELELARKEIRDIVREVREQPSRTAVLQSARQKLAERKQEISAEGAKIEKEESGAAVHDHSIRPGDPVRLSETTTVGEVEEIQGDNAVILCGNFRITTALKGLEKISRAQEKKLSKEQEHLQKKSSWSLHSSDDISTRLDLRGLTGEEAISEIGRFIDRLLLNRIFTATIIHGKGSGSLRQKTASFLQQHRHVKSFRLGDWSEGGAGVTIVELE